MFELPVPVHRYGEFDFCSQPELPFLENVRNFRRDVEIFKSIHSNVEENYDILMFSDWIHILGNFRKKYFW